MATEVEFHTGVADLVGFAGRLLRKAYRRGAQLLVLAPDPLLQELDRLLWTQEALDFLPHVRLPAPPQLATRSPIWLAAQWPGEEAATARVVVNLGLELQAAPERYPRIIEVVGAEPEAAEAGRQRWRSYKALGLGIVHHNAA